MNRALSNHPVVMCIGAHDPSGGGGLSAAIETLASLGCHCTPIVSSLAAADTHGMKDSQLTGTTLLIEQIRAVLEDIHIDLFSIGRLPTVAHIEVVHTILSDYPTIPVVLRPLIDPAQGAEHMEALRDLLIPEAIVSIINTHQLKQFAFGADTTAAAAQALQEYGADDLLITGDAYDGDEVCNQWFTRRGLRQQYRWPQLGQQFSGASGTLAAAASGYLAHGFSIAEALQQAQTFTWQALKEARPIGSGKLIPNRMHWCKN